HDEGRRRDDVSFARGAVAFSRSGSVGVCGWFVVRNTSAWRKAKVSAARACKAKARRARLAWPQAWLYDSGATVARRPLAERADGAFANFNSRSRRLDKLTRDSRSTVS